MFNEEFRIKLSINATLLKFTIKNYALRAVGKKPTHYY